MEGVSRKPAPKWVLKAQKGARIAITHHVFCHPVVCEWKEPSLAPGQRTTGSSITVYAPHMPRSHLEVNCLHRQENTILWATSEELMQEGRLEDEFEMHRRITVVPCLFSLHLMYPYWWPVLDSCISDCGCIILPVGNKVLVVLLGKAKLLHPQKLEDFTGEQWEAYTKL